MRRGDATLHADDGESLKLRHVRALERQQPLDADRLDGEHKFIPAVSLIVGGAEKCNLSAADGLAPDKRT